MLDYELFDYFDNQIMNPTLFKQKIKNRMRTQENFDVKDVNHDLNCPICFLGMD